MYKHNHSVSVIIYNTLTGRALSKEVKFKPSSASFSFICLHLQLAFHDLYSVQYFFFFFKLNGTYANSPKLSRILLAWSPVQVTKFLDWKEKAYFNCWPFSGENFGAFDAFLWLNCRNSSFNNSF